MLLDRFVCIGKRDWLVDLSFVGKGPAYHEGPGLGKSGLGCHFVALSRAQGPCVSSGAARILAFLLLSIDEE